MSKRKTVEKIVVDKSASKTPFLRDESDDYSEYESEEMSGGDDYPDDDNEHLDRDLDTEGESSDGPGGEDTDGEFDPTEHEELEDDDVVDGDEEYDDVGGDEGEEEGDYPKRVKCHLKDFDETSVIAEDDSIVYSKLEYKQVPKEERQTRPTMTYYELTRILGNRAEQIKKGAPVLVKGIDHLTEMQQAYIELLEKKNIFKIRRHLPGKLYEDWDSDELEIIHILKDEFFVPSGIAKKS